MSLATILMFGVGFSAPATAQTPADPDECQLVQGLAAELNETLPSPINKIAQLLRVDVNCAESTFIYEKRFLIPETDLLPDWEAREQAFHTDVHCAFDGMAAAFGWTAMDIIYGPNDEVLATIVTTPASCGGK